MTPSEVSLREYIEALIAERDRLYQEQFRQIDQAVKVALAAKGTDHADSQWSIGLLAAVTIGIIDMALTVFMLLKK